MSETGLPPRKIKCPLCGRSTVYSLENPSRPFCSERCRLTDLGQWAEGSYQIPSQADESAGPSGDEEESD